ncbi:DUF2812 domain-containing protein [Bacillus salitolerans]|uniref:DUF2812 domain-containing protein n=1 Tax=Bacillus salitolerans TaxID=1437434 RepID=A0ABW4LS46_9BACI
MTKYKKVFKVFWAWQDNKEEKWLNEMANSGWKLKNYNLTGYTFEKCEPNNYVYKLDYKSTSNCDLHEYISIFHDAGWEHVTQFTGWHYFRTESNGTDFPDIFSDVESKIQKYRSLSQNLVISLLVLIVVSFNVLFSKNISFAIFIKSVYVGLIGLLIMAIWKVKQKINSLHNE